MYEAPNTEIGQTPESPKVKIPISAYILAGISWIFVSFGVMIAFAFSHVFVGPWVDSIPHPVMAIFPLIAIALGALSARQSIQQAKRKALEKLKSGQKPSNGVPQKNINKEN